MTRRGPPAWRTQVHGDSGAALTVPAWPEGSYVRRSMQPCACMVGSGSTAHKVGDVKSAIARFQGTAGFAFGAMHASGRFSSGLMVVIARRFGIWIPVAACKRRSHAATHFPARHHTLFDPVSRRSSQPTKSQVHASSPLGGLLVQASPMALPDAPPQQQLPGAGAFGSPAAATQRETESRQQSSSPRLGRFFGLACVGACGVAAAAKGGAAAASTALAGAALAGGARHFAKWRTAEVSLRACVHAPHACWNRGRNTLAMHGSLERCGDLDV